MEFDHTVLVHAPPDVVYEIVAEPQDHAPRAVVAELVKEPPGATHAGTRWREAVRLGPFLEVRTRTEATVVDPPHPLEMRWRGPLMHGDLTYTLDACPEGTRFRQQETMAAVGPLRPFGGMVGRALARHLVARMEDIRVLAESGTVVPR